MLDKKMFEEILKGSKEEMEEIIDSPEFRTISNKIDDLLKKRIEETEGIEYDEFVEKTLIVDAMKRLQDQDFEIVPGTFYRKSDFYMTTNTAIRNGDEVVKVLGFGNREFFCLNLVDDFEIFLNDLHDVEFDKIDKMLEIITTKDINLEKHITERLIFVQR